MVRFQHCRMLVLPNHPMACKAWSAGSMVAQCLGPEPVFIWSPELLHWDVCDPHLPHL